MKLRPQPFVIEGFDFRWIGPPLIALHDLIDEDVPPASFVLIDDFDPGRFSGQIAHVPGLPIEMLAIGAGGRANRLAVDEQVNAGLARMIAAAEQEIDIAAFDPKVARGERADRAIPFEKAVDQSVPRKAAHLHLIGQRATSGPRAESLPRGLPRAVIGSLEIGDENIGLLIGSANLRHAAGMQAGDNNRDRNCGQFQLHHFGAWDLS